jgi:hypothetical protein
VAVHRGKARSKPGVLDAQALSAPFQDPLDEVVTVVIEHWARQVFQFLKPSEDSLQGVASSSINPCKKVDFRQSNGHFRLMMLA